MDNILTEISPDLNSLTAESPKNTNQFLSAWQDKIVTKYPNFEIIVVTNDFNCQQAILNFTVVNQGVILFWFQVEMNP